MPPGNSHKKTSGPVYFDILPILPPIGIILGLITVYLALSKRVDIYTAVFRGVLVFAAFIFIGIVFHFIYILMLKRIKELEAKRIAEEIREAQEKARMEAEKQAAAAAANQPPPARPPQR